MNKFNTPVDGASVKIMRSFDYCHFEVCLSLEPGDVITSDQVDNLRKDAMRLVDKAVEQYKVAKETRENADAAEIEVSLYLKKAQVIKENFPVSEWTPEQKAIVKRAADIEFVRNLNYDYEDDWQEPRVMESVE